MYRYSFTQNYSYTDKLVTFRLGQIYYVSPYTSRDIRQEPGLKEKLDKRVEDDVIHQLEKTCNEQKRKRQAYLNKAKHYSYSQRDSDFYLNKAESVNMDACTKLKEDKEII